MGHVIVDGGSEGVATKSSCQEGVGLLGEDGCYFVVEDGGVEKMVIEEL